jgi:hypothetical protein
MIYSHVHGLGVPWTCTPTYISGGTNIWHLPCNPHPPDVLHPLQQWYPSNVNPKSPSPTFPTCKYMPTSNTQGNATHLKTVYTWNHGTLPSNYDTQMQIRPLALGTNTNGKWKHSFHCPRQPWAITCGTNVIPSNYDSKYNTNLNKIESINPSNTMW